MNTKRELSPSAAATLALKEHQITARHSSSIVFELKPNNAFVLKKVFGITMV